MTALTPSRITVNGVELNNYAYLITERSGWDSTPGLVGSNVRVPGRDGEVWRAKDYGPSRMVLDLYIGGNDEDGAVPNGSTADITLRNNLDKLFAIFGRRHRLIQVDKLMEDETTRRNFAEVGAVLQPEYFGANAAAKLTVELVFPDPIWYDTDTTSLTPAGSATNNRDIAQTQWTGSTAPITDGIYIFKGPAANPYITDAVSGGYIRFDGTLTGNQDWRINAKTFTSEVGNNLGFSWQTGNINTGTSVIAQTRFSGPRFFVATPDADTLTPVLNITGTGMTSRTALYSYGYRKFLA